MTIGNMHKIWKNLFPHHLCPSDPHSCNPSLNLTSKLQLHTLLLHLNLTNNSHFTCLKWNSSFLLCHLNSDHFLPRLQLPPQSRDLSSHLELQRKSLTLFLLHPMRCWGIPFLHSLPEVVTVEWTKSQKDTLVSKGEGGVWRVWDGVGFEGTHIYSCFSQEGTVPTLPFQGPYGVSNFM